VPTPPHVLRFGVIVPSKRYRATRRNRLKRLIRESIAAQWDDWVTALVKESSACEVIVFYKGSDHLVPEKVRLKDVDDDLGRIRSMIVSKKL
jgi:ribonuclease P protein component